MRTLVKNAHLLDARGDHGVHDLYLQDGLIEGLDAGGEVDRTFDAEGQLVTPAFIYQLGQQPPISIDMGPYFRATVIVCVCK